MGNKNNIDISIRIRIIIINNVLDR